jgi:hypothetical protein
MHSNSSSSSSTFNFEAFLDTLNRRRVPESAQERQATMLAQQLIFLLRNSPVPEDQLVSGLSREFHSEEDRVRQLLEQLLRREFVTRDQDRTISLTPFARKALSYFSVSSS